jgi:hypothetical protein
MTDENDAATIRRLNDANILIDEQGTNAPRTG